MDKYRSTINPLTIIVNVILYGVLLYLIYIKTPHLFIVGCVVVLLYILLMVRKLFSYKYYLGLHGLTIIHKRKQILVLYKDIKYVEIDSRESGMIYGYGVRRLLICTGKGLEQSYLITPEKEKIFIENLEIKVKNSKKGTN